jgi:tRNA 2-selenouridine synthase
MKQINFKDTLDKNYIFIDTRSPKEFKEDHIPNALNLPLFDNEQRATIGLIYKNNQEEAYSLGLNYLQEKIPHIIQKINDLNIDKTKEIIIYCFRGGMRSKVITKIFNELKFKVYQLKNGYKSYRAYTLDYLTNNPINFTPIVLHGLAGSGKTDLIKILKPSIDLEGLAQHRSSIFGEIGLKPNTQKMFDSLLFEKLKILENEKYIFIEGESKKIGNVQIPDILFKAMNNGIKVYINTPQEKRNKIIVRDYFTHNKDDLIKEKIISLKRALSKKIVDEILLHLTNKNYEKVSEMLLIHYYDPKYNHVLHEIKYDYKINHEDLKSLNNIKNLEIKSK